jgi:hypothetical protein
MIKETFTRWMKPVFSDEQRLNFSRDDECNGGKIQKKKCV